MPLSIFAAKLQLCSWSFKKQSENMTEEKKKKTRAYIETLIKTAIFSYKEEMDNQR